MTPIYNLKELLTPAYQNNFAVLACNIRHPLIMRACLEAAFQLKAPIILEIAESEQAYCDWSPEEVAEEVLVAIEICAHYFGYRIPVGLHLDHVQKDEALIGRAVKAGFRSTLLDLSRLSDQENHARCAYQAQILHAQNVSLEIEQGCIGFAKDLPHDVEQLYVTVDQAVAAVDAVHPDALAIAVGNGHGLYAETPHIGFGRIKEVASALCATKTPLVLHGGSGLSLEVFSRAVAAGINKVNYATALSDFLFAHLPSDLLVQINQSAAEQGVEQRKVLGQFKNAIRIMPKLNKQAVHQAIVDNVSQLISVSLGSANRLDLYV